MNTPTDVPVVDIDPFSTEFLTDPYDGYTRLREAGPLVWIPKYGIYATARHAEVRDVLKATGFEAKAVPSTTLTTGLTADVDVLVVGGTLNATTLNTANKAAYDAFIARGGGVVGLGTAGSPGMPW